MALTSSSWMDQLLAAMSGWQASDLFITEGKVPAVRVQGTVRPVKRPATSKDELRAWIDAAFTKAQVARLDDEGDLDAGYTLEDGRRFRINLSRQRSGTGLVSWKIAPRRKLEATRTATP